MELRNRKSNRMGNSQPPINLQNQQPVEIPDEIEERLRQPAEPNVEEVDIPAPAAPLQQPAEKNEPHRLSVEEIDEGIEKSRQIAEDMQAGPSKSNSPVRKRYIYFCL